MVTSDKAETATIRSQQRRKMDEEGSWKQVRKWCEKEPKPENAGGWYKREKCQHKLKTAQKAHGNRCDVRFLDCNS